MEMVLIRENLYGVVFDNIPEVQNDEWVKFDRQARALICLHIADSQVIHVLHEKTAKDTWEKLKRIHERANLSSKLFLLRKLYSIKFNESKNMQEHIKDVMQLSEKLTSIGEPIKETHLGAILLCSLPPSYDVLVTSLESKNEDELSFDYIQSKLIDEYLRRNENKLNSPPNTQALKVHQKFSGPKKYCTYCHRKGHLKIDCWHLVNKNKNSAKYQGKNDTKYHGQKSNVCNASEKEKQVTKNKSVKQNDCNVNKSENIALEMQSKNNKGKNEWILDSGCTMHMTGNQNFFTELSRTQNNSVTIANGAKLESHGLGSG